MVEWHGVSYEHIVENLMAEELKDCQWAFDFCKEKHDQEMRTDAELADAAHDLANIEATIIWWGCQPLTRV